MCLMACWLVLVTRSPASGTPPIISVQPLSLTVPVLGSATFSVVALSGTTMSYQWSQDGKKISGATNNSYVISSLATNSAGAYSVKISNSGGSTTSSNATLTVQVIPPSITLQPSSVSLDKHASATFNVGASGSAPLYYQWYFNNSPIKNETNSSYTNSKIQKKDAGTYYAVVTNAAGSATSSVADISLTAPTIKVTTKKGRKALDTNGFTFELSMPVSYTYVVMASSDFVNWLPISTNISATTNIVFVDSAATNTQCRVYKVVIQ